MSVEKSKIPINQKLETSLSPIKKAKKVNKTKTKKTFVDFLILTSLCRLKGKGLSKVSPPCASTRHLTLNQYALE